MIIDKKNMKDVDKKSLLGEIQAGKIPCTGGNVPDPQKLNEPVEGPASAMQAFCAGCGTHFEASKATAEAFFKIAAGNPAKPFSLQDYYLEFSSCNNCSGKNGEISVELKKIPKLQK